MALPPERIDRTMGMCMHAHLTAELDFQLRLSIFVQPGTMWFHVMGAEPNPDQLGRVRHAIDIYKGFVRPLHPTSRIYHHTPVVEGFDPRGWGVLEVASADGTRALAGLFRLSDPTEPEYLLRLRGLDVSRRYRVTFDNSGRSCALDGFTLCHTGISIRLETALTSELLLIEPLE
jgi:alpha-galactosidase